MYVALTFSLIIKIYKKCNVYTTICPQIAPTKQAFGPPHGQELLIKRDYQAQKMRVKQAELYREDIRDLVQLTVRKMAPQVEDESSKVLSSLLILNHLKSMQLCGFWQAFRMR